MRAVSRTTTTAATFLASLLVSACASAPPAAPSETRVEIDDQGRIAYAGSLTPEANARVMELFDTAEDKPETILISSGGGSIALGLDLAEWILDHGLDVEVGDRCLSSCANYVLLAGAAKKLRRDSMLLWHGSAWQESFDHFAEPDDPDYAPSFVEVRSRESRFFDRIGVDNLIAVYGEPVTWGDRLRWLIGRSKLGFDYDLADLERMGVSNIELLDGEWDWREYHPEYASRVRRVSLDEDYEFTPSRFGER